MYVCFKSNKKQNEWICKELLHIPLLPLIMSIYDIAQDVI